MNEEFFLIKPISFYDCQADYKKAFRKSGSRLDQKYFYWDRLGAYNWLKLCHKQGREEYPLGDDARTELKKNINDIVEKILSDSEHDSIDIISLGVGNGQDDDVIIGAIKETERINHINFFAYDISIDLICHSLLEIEKNHSDIIIADKLSLHAINDDFENLDSDYNETFHQNENIKLFHLLGSTISNFDEDDLIYKISSVLGEKDYLLIGVDCGHDNIFSLSTKERNKFIIKNSNSELGYNFLLGPIKSALAMYVNEQHKCLKRYNSILPYIHSLKNNKIKIYGEESSYIKKEPPNTISKIDNTLTMKYRIGLKNQNFKGIKNDVNNDPILNISHKYRIESFLDYLSKRNEFKEIAVYAPEIITSKSTRYCLVLLQKTAMNNKEQKEIELSRKLEIRISIILSKRKDLSEDTREKAKRIQSELRDNCHLIGEEQLEKWLDDNLPLETLILEYEKFMKKVKKK